jgi:cytochrome c-type biogenesis protein CcmH/NrfG
MKPSTPFSLLGACALAASCVVALAQSPAGATRYDAARDEYEIGHYDRAFAAFAQLADEGHCDAARMAQQMVRYGRPLYHAEFKVASERLERWQRLPGCPVALAAR